jgi:hypothetical protein
MRPDSSSCHYFLYLALLELSREIWVPLNPPTSTTEASSATVRASGPVDHAVRTSEVEEPSMSQGLASNEGSEVGPDPTPLDALSQMSTSERIAFGNSLFFKKLEPLEDESVDWD